MTMTTAWTAAAAVDVLGMGKPHWELRNMATALGLMSYLNSEAETERRSAALWALKHWKAYTFESRKRRAKG
jgi:hypothetical protein